MTRVQCAAVVFLVCCVCGCATTSPFVGQWRSQDLPQDAKDDGVAAVALFISEDGTFAGTIDDEHGVSLDGFSGTWRAESDKAIAFEVTEGNGPPTGTGQLIDKDTMLGVGGDVSIRFKKKTK